VQTIKDFWPIIVFMLGLFGWLFILTFRIGGIYAWYKESKENSGKINDGVEGKKMADKHETNINDIRKLCGVRGEQIARLETNVMIMLEAQRNLSMQQSKTMEKLDSVAVSIINLAGRHERTD
jgi:hypothetical protein